VSATFVSQLRSGRPPIKLAEPVAGTIMFRVGTAEIWETVRVMARPETTVAEAKKRVIAELFPGEHVEDFVLKLRGWEVLDERSSLGDSGVVNGSILLLAYRRRRPVR
jgi:hypothetical protein